MFVTKTNKSQFVDIFPHLGKGNKIFPVTGERGKNIDNMFPHSGKDNKIFPDSNRGN